MKTHLKNNKTESKFFRNFLKEKASTQQSELLKTISSSKRKVNRCYKNLTIKSINGMDSHPIIHKTSKKLKREAIKGIYTMS